MTEERISGGYAALKTESTDVPVQVSGIALGENDITRGGSGKKTLWPRETLEEAAKGLEGQPLATDQNHTTDGTQPQTPSKAVIGEITWSGYKPGVGVLYEAELDDPDIARSVQNGRLEVSPLVSREVEPLEDHPEAEFKATEITRWRDLATVVNGAAPSNEITVGDNPMRAEALHEVVEALQTDIDLTPPQDVQDHAQDVLDWREDDEKDVQGMTDTGWDRAEQLASGESLSVDDVQNIAAWFARHGSDEYELNEEGMDPWRDNGRVAIKGWGGPPMRSWIMDKREQLTEAGELEAMMEALQLSEARTPEYDGTESADWSEVSKDLSDTVDAVGIDAESVEDLTAEQKQAIADHTLLGDPEAETWGELFFFPVVNPNNQNLNENALDAVRGGRGAQADIPEDAYESAESVARDLLAEEFDREFESMAAVEDVNEGTLVRWDSSGDRDAFGMVEEVRTEGDEPLDSEIDGDQTIDPPAALITVHTPGEDGWTETETQVGHTLNTDTLEVIDELPDAESLSKHMDSLEEIPDEFIFDNPGEAVSKAKDMGFSNGAGDDLIHTHGEGEDTVFMPGPSHDALLDMMDTQSDDGTQESMSQSSVALAVDTTTMNEDEINAVVSAAESVENPVDRVESLAAADDPKIVEQDTYEALNNAVESLDSMMSDTLTEEVGLSERAVEAMSFEAKAAHFENDEGEFDGEALMQSPETGQPDESETEALSEDADMEKAEALYQDMEKFGVDHSDTITEALGVSDWDTAKEVLD